MKLATKTAVIVTGQMAAAMVTLARTLGAQLSELASETGPGQRAEESEKVREAKKVASAGVAAAVTVIDAGTASLKAILATSCDGISEVVGHKYGEHAGHTCGEGLGIVKDVVEAGTNMRHIGVKGLAKVAGKEAAKNYLVCDRIRVFRNEKQQ